MRDKLTDAVYLVVKTLNEQFQKTPGRTEIIKLLYLLDLESLKKNGKTLTGTTYRYHYFGPFSKDILDAIERLVEEDILEDIPEIDHEEGYVKHNYRVLKRKRISLNEEERRTVTGILKKYGNLPLRELLSVVYNTEPMLEKKKGEVLIG